MRRLAFVLVALASTGCGDKKDGPKFVNVDVDAAPADVILNPPTDAQDASDGPTDAPFLCTNGKKDGKETDVDCGGPECAKCAEGKDCVIDGDCIEGKCAPGNKCAAPACNDGVKNGKETDVDCGGECPAKCADGKKCSANGDCANALCVKGVCAPASCSDGVKNGAETDVDCGGACPTKCGVGKGCAAGGDCITKVCDPGSGTCACPAFMVRVDAKYCIDQTEVTSQQYATFLDDKPSVDSQIAECKSWNTSFVPSAAWPASDLSAPVRYVDWCDAYAYCNKQGKHLCGKIGGGASSFGGSSADAGVDSGSTAEANDPESEWYNACSQGGALAYPYGDYKPSSCNGADHQRSVDAGSPGPWPVVKFGGLPDHVECFGGVLKTIYQLSGNVAEWENACSASAGASDECLVRGGSYASEKDDLQCSSRRTARRDTRAADIGFRCCL